MTEATIFELYTLQFSHNTPDSLLSPFQEYFRLGPFSVLVLAGLAVQTGARSAIASLWQINDRSTSKLAAEFYRGYSQGLSKAAALRRAQLKLLDSDELQHLYYWAAFILVGGGS